MRPYLPIFTLLFLLTYPLNAQSPTDLPLDSLVRWVKANVWDVNSNKNVEKIHGAAFVCLERAKQEGDIPVIVEAAQNMALFHFAAEIAEIPDSSLYYDQVALEYLLKTDDQAAIAKAYAYVGGDYRNHNDAKNAQTNMLKALEIFEQIGDERGVAKMYVDLCSLLKRYDREKAIEYGYKGIAILEDMEELDSSQLCMSYFYMADPLIETGRLEEALEAGHKSVGYLGEFQYRNYGMTMRAYAWRGDAYLALKRYDEALVDHTYAWEFGKSQVEDDSSVSGFKVGIGQVLYAQGRYQEAISYMEDHLLAMEERDALQDAYGMRGPFRQLSDCYEKVGAHDKALVAYKQYTLLQDEIDAGEVKRLESELLDKYESEKKDEQIATQATQLAQQQQIQRLYIGLASLLGVILLGLFLVYRRNKQTNQELTGLNQKLGVKNEQNELLLKEIHHRVKNNLQTISSLLSLQSAHIEDPEIQGAVEQSQNRVFSMALIHQKLYQGENLAAIEMRDYLQMLGETIVDSFGIDTEKIQIEYPMEAMELDVDTAIPVGLIANELLTNALKYAFPSGQEGKIQVSLQRIGEAFQFKVADNGVGLSPAKLPEGTGFGSHLVKLLVQQLRGSMTINNEDGLSTQVEFVAV